jgi:hypothetical protein
VVGDDDELAARDDDAERDRRADVAPVVAERRTLVLHQRPRGDGDRQIGQQLLQQRRGRGLTLRRHVVALHRDAGGDGHDGERGDPAQVEQVPRRVAAGDGLGDVRAVGQRQHEQPDAERDPAEPAGGGEHRAAGKHDGRDGDVGERVAERVDPREQAVVGRVEHRLQDEDAAREQRRGDDDDGVEGEAEVGPPAAPSAREPYDADDDRHGVEDVGDVGDRRERRVLAEHQLVDAPHHRPGGPGEAAGADPGPAAAPGRGAATGRPAARRGGERRDHERAVAHDLTGVGRGVVRRQPDGEAGDADQREADRQQQAPSAGGRGGRGRHVGAVLSLGRPTCRRAAVPTAPPRAEMVIPD